MIMMQQYLDGTIITWYLNNILSDKQNITNPFLHVHDVPYAGKYSRWNIFMKGLFWSIHEFKFSRITTILAPTFNFSSPAEPRVQFIYSTCELLTCMREAENDADPYSVAMINSSMTVVGS